jgi:hypothetical protein
MNILLGALLLALLLLPGFIFRTGYLARPFSSKSFSSSFLEELLFSLLPAFFLQISGYLIVELWRGVNEVKIILLLTNSDKSALHPLNATDIGLFAVYLSTLFVIAFGLGFALRQFAIRTRLHLRYTLFRIFNEWEIYFEGYILDYPDKAGEAKKVMYSWVDVLVDTKEGSYIYSGFLDKYVLGKDESLNRLYLTAVRRRPFVKDALPAINPPVDAASADEVNYDLPEDPVPDNIETGLDDRYYFMPGDYFMIPGDEIRSVNITYYTE